MRAELLALLLVAGPLSAEPRFAKVDDVPRHVYAGGWEHFVGGGVAVFDCNGDDLPELFAAGGENPAMLLLNGETAGGDLKFSDATPDALNLTGVTGAYPLDIDGDGHFDLAVLRVGENLLMRGAPDCAFTPFDKIGFTSGDHWTTAFSATWETGNTLPTLAFGNYVDRSDPKGPFRACDVNHLYRPDGARYQPPTSLVPGYCPLSMLFSDWGRTGRADLRLSNDRHYYVDQGQEQLWRMDDAPRLFDETDGWKRHMLWGMGIASRDVNRDGKPDVFLTSMGDQRLQFRVGDQPTFQDAPFATGTTAQRPYLGGDGRPSTGWHVAFGDVQNDGLDDIFVTKGNVEQMPDSAMDDPNNLLMQNRDGQFVERGGAAGLASLHRGRGGALVDLNADGLLDVVVVNRRAPIELYRNVTRPSGNWLTVSLAQSGPNTHAVGGWIEIDDGRGPSQLREITVGGGHAGGSAVPEHFGLGPAEKVRLRVVWPGNVVSDWVETETSRRLRIAPSGTGLTLSPY
ncbi:CRTAC1 family protein [Arenibacterium sp. CAU 1754]